MNSTKARKNARKATNRALAAALRSYGLTPNGEVWNQAKGLVKEGLTPKQAARLVRSTLSATEQDVARTKGRVTKAPVAQAPLPAQAQRVKDGKVLRDAKGRIVSREIQEALELING